MKILVVGLQTHDAGKTTLSKALIHGFKNANVNLIPFKPHSGISYWTQFDTVQECIVKGVLLSSDILELERVAQSGIPVEVLNPVNRLSSPLFHRGMPEEKLAFREFVAQRFTQYDGVKPRNVYYLNGTKNFSKMRGMRELYLAVREKAGKVVFIRDFQQLVKAYSDHFDKATSSCYRFLDGKPLLLESFNDAAYPRDEIGDCDVVLGACSDMVLQFKADEYFRAIESHHQKPKSQLTVDDIYSSELIERKYHVQPLSHQERSDPAGLAYNYSEIINKLVEMLR